MLRPLFIILFIIPITSNSQDIIYRLVLEDPCNNKYEYSLLHQLNKIDSVYSIQDTLGTIYLTQTGNYNLDASLYQINKEVKIERGVNIDTLKVSTIYECLQPLLHPNFIGYCCCGEKCEGSQRDYYNNGKLRISGTFKSGHPIGKLIEYYPNGQVKEVRLYDKQGKGILKRKNKYDQEGNEVQ